jgi:DivIVA domain-containing protein
MTLTRDDVRNKRFRMASKPGYEVLEVDQFVNDVEESFAQLLAENHNLKKQVEALKSAPPVPARTPAPLAQAPTVQPPAPRRPAPVQPSMSGTIVVTTGKEAGAAVVRLIEMSTEQAERLVEEATEDANRIREGANRTAHQLTTDAGTRAERVESEARVNAERLKVDAISRAEKLDREIESRRIEMFGDLERQRDDLTAVVAALRNSKRHTERTSAATCASKSRLWSPAKRRQSRCRRKYMTKGRPSIAQRGLLSRVAMVASSLATSSNARSLEALLGDQG